MNQYFMHHLGSNYPLMCEISNFSHKPLKLEDFSSIQLWCLLIVFFVNLCLKFVHHHIYPNQVKHQSQHHFDKTRHSKIILLLLLFLKSKEVHFRYNFFTVNTILVNLQIFTLFFYVNHNLLICKVFEHQ